ncbi:MAG: hypothetical protein GY925_28085, partial [Actinomycetia bacterium]|nr:hypothetical protein [Actinomycetes bacterium]
MVTPSHPAAGALTGTVTVLDVPARMNYVSAGSMPAGATAIATVAGDADKVVAWVIETGDELAYGRSAPARRAGFLFVYDSASHATADCWTMFDAAVGWVANESSAVTPSATYTGSDPTAGGTAAVGKYTGRMWAIGDTGQLPELEVSAAFGVPWNEEPSEGVGIDRFEFDGLYTYDQDSAAIVVCPFGDQTPFFAFDGTVGGYVSTPDTAANSITGDLDVAVRVSFDDVTPAANESLVGEWSTAPNLAYLLAIHTSGALRLYTSTTGSDSVTGTSTATLGSVTSAGTAVWVRATYDASTGDKEFFYSLDDVEVESAVSWTQLGATVSGTSGAIPDTTSDLMVGAHGGGGSWNLAGEIYVAEVYDDDGIVERIAAADATVG